MGQNKNKNRKEMDGSDVVHQLASDRMNALMTECSNLKKML